MFEEPTPVEFVDKTCEVSNDGSYQVVAAHFIVKGRPDQRVNGGDVIMHLDDHSQMVAERPTEELEREREMWQG